MGSGAFAQPILQAILESENTELVGAATQPDKAAGRKRILTPSPLGRWADLHGIPCERVPSVNAEDFLAGLRAKAPDLVVVVSFGQILKQPLLDLPRLGCLNVHASILPKYRGASPIATAILNGDAETGVTFMKMERGLDSGPMYAVSRMPIPQDITTETLEQRLSEMAGRRIAEVIGEIADGKQPVNQPEEGVTVAVKIRKPDGSVDWTEDAFLIERKIRAYAKWPDTRFCVRCRDRFIQIKILAARATSWSSASGVPGQILSLPENKRQMMVQCGKGALLIERVLPEGKKEMAVSDFLNGVRLTVGDVLCNGPDKLTAG